MMYNVTNLMHYLKVIDWISSDLTKLEWKTTIQKAAKDFCKKNNLIITEDMISLYLNWKAGDRQ